MRIGGVVLAAGQSTRMGRMKLLLPYEGRPLVAAALEAMSSSGADPVLCVLGYRSAEVLEALRHVPFPGPIRFILNRKHETGRASSVRLAQRALPEECAGAVFLPGDMPLIRPSDIRSLIDRFEQTGAPIVVGVDEEGRRAHPVLFARRLFPRLAARGGDESGHALLQALWDDVEKVLVPANRVLDVDYEEDYRNLVGEVGSGRARVL